MQGVGKHVSLAQLCGLICLFFLALPLQFVAQVCAVSFKVFIGELCFGEIGCRSSSVIVMLFPLYFRA